jgi:UDP-GlcNAc:undecaprenyl-phosphate GlcNAc-1-phosphate transferase
MIASLCVCSLSTFFFSFFFHKFGIRFAEQWKLVAIPNARRRHHRVTPVVGGLAIFMSWSLGLILFSFLSPAWFHAQWPTLLPVSISLAILITLGVVDDIKGLSPRPKVIFQAVASAIVLAYEPNIHSLCSYWTSSIGIAVWPLAMIWIMGITNAINLIDGLDGLAGGTSFFVCSSILVLSIWTGSQAIFSTVIIALALPALLAFLYFNWNPARLFLGDNGSLPLGFLIAISSLMCRPQTKSWVMIASVVLMMGYPILDMGMVITRRFRNGLALFKADRNHLHFRVQRLGLSVRQTAVLLLSITAYLQIGALVVNQMDPVFALVAIAVICFSIGSLLWVVLCTEKSKVALLWENSESGQFFKTSEPPAVNRYVFTALNIDLTSLLEASLFEEKQRYQLILSSLESTLRATLRRGDDLIVSSKQITVLLHDVGNDPEIRRRIKKRFQTKLEMFSALIDLQCSLSALPISFDNETYRADDLEEPGHSPRSVA